MKYFLHVHINFGGQSQKWVGLVWSENSKISKMNKWNKLTFCMLLYELPREFLNDLRLKPLGN